MKNVCACQRMCEIVLKMKRHKKLCRGGIIATHTNWRNSGNNNANDECIYVQFSQCNLYAIQIERENVMMLLFFAC